MNEPVVLDINNIGQPLRRKEDDRLITGKGRFTDDFSLPGQSYAAMVRSPHPHARILAVRKEMALAMPGVLGVFTGVDCAADGLGAIPHDPIPKTKYDMKLTGPGGSAIFIGPHVLLPADKARHVGEAVAMVVAKTEAQAQDAAEAVEIDWEVLPFVLGQEDALAQGAAEVWDEASVNTLVDTTFGDVAATDAAFATADHVVKLELHIPRVTAAAMEPRAALGYCEPRSGMCELYVGGGGAVRQKNEIASVLKMDPANLRVMTFDVGGNFGAKNRVYVEYGLVLWASQKLGVPVKHTSSRYESLLTDYQGRDLLTRVELALRKDGKFLAFRADNISNVGARCVSLSPLGKGSGLITGSYNIPVATLRARAVFTNTMPTQAYRSSGRPEVNYAIERLIDTAAREIGFDRISLRRKNLVRPKQMPYTNAVGATYDSGEYETQLDLALHISDWKGFAKRKRDAAKRGKLAGLGLAHYVESSIGAPRERAEITVKPEGRVELIIGTQPSGQGHETSFSQVIADLIRVPVDLIDIVMGDTRVVRIGGGTHSGRSMRHAATVMSKGAAMLIVKGKRIAGQVLGVGADQIDWQDGRFTARGSNRSFDMLELAREAESPAVNANSAPSRARCFDRWSDDFSFRRPVARRPANRCPARARAKNLCPWRDSRASADRFPSGANACDCRAQLLFRAIESADRRHPARQSASRMFFRSREERQTAFARNPSSTCLAPDFQSRLLPDLPPVAGIVFSGGSNGFAKLRVRIEHLAIVTSDRHRGVNAAS